MALRKQALGIALGAATLLVALAGVAWAAIPGSGGVINGCYGKQTGILRVIDGEAGKSCLSFETPFNWNQQGPKGDPGAPGARGERGPAGPAMTVVRVGALGQSVSLAHCLIGEVATGGGGQASGAGPALSHSLPLTAAGSTTPTGWIARTSDPDGFVQAYAVCAAPGT